MESHSDLHALRIETERKNKEAQELIQKEEDETKALFGYVLDNDHGKRLLEKLMNFSNYLIPSYYPGRNKDDMIFDEGMKNVVNYVLAQLDYKIDFIKKELGPSPKKG